MTNHIDPNTSAEEIVATVRDKYGKIAQRRILLRTGHQLLRLRTGGPLHESRLPSD